MAPARCTSTSPARGGRKKPTSSSRAWAAGIRGRSRAPVESILTRADGTRRWAGGSPEATRRAFNKRFLLDLAEDWQGEWREVFKRVRRESPAAYLKVCAMLVPREMKLEHSGGVKAMAARAHPGSAGNLDARARNRRECHGN